MTVQLQIPPENVPLYDAKGFMTTPWRTFFNQLVTRAGGITGGLQPADDTLDGLASMNATPGLVTEVSADVFVKRSVTGAAGRIAVTNGNGVAGGPVIDLAPVPGVAGVHAPVNSLTVDGYGRITAIT